jgi:hypothetical protein
MGDLHMTKHEREEIQARIDREVDAAGLGWDYFKESPDELLAAVAVMASGLYKTKDEELAFLHGYQQARAKREEYLREQENADHH